MTSATEPLPNLTGQPWLQAEQSRKVLAAIEAGGFTARAVGGVVRNALMGLPVTDIDIATTARPEDVMRLARAAGLGVAETGLKHGTVTVIADHHPFEVTTLRRDVESHGRHATVAFTDDWTEDAQRRDFTMNALYCDAAGRVYDPVGGYPDILDRRVRFIGRAEDRIREDYLRILRFFRFTAQYGAGDVDPGGLSACTRLREGLAQLSRERIHQEVSRLLVARRARLAITTMQEHGILGWVVPAAPSPKVLARIIALEEGYNLVPGAMLRLAALAVRTSEDAARIGRALKVSREERGVLDLAARPCANLSSAPDGAGARAMLYRAGAVAYRRQIALSWARALDTSLQSPAWIEALSLPERWSAPKLPVTGTDAMAQGIPAGTAIGDALRATEQWWIEQDFAPDREALLKRLELHR